GGQSDDAAPGGPSLSVTASELRDEQRCAAGVYGELSLERRGRDTDEVAAEPVARRYGECVCQPAAGVVHEYVHRAEVGLRGVEKPARRCRIREIGFQRRRLAAGSADGSDDVIGIGG